MKNQDIYEEITVPFIAYLSASSLLSEKLLQDRKLLSSLRLKFTVLAHILLENGDTNPSCLLKHLVEIARGRDIDFENFLEMLLAFLFFMQQKILSFRNMNLANEWNKKSIDILAYATLQYQVDKNPEMRLLTNALPDIFTRGSKYADPKLEFYQQTFSNALQIERLTTQTTEYKITAREFMLARYDELLEIDELIDLENELSSILYITEEIDDHLLKKAETLFERYSKNIGKIPDFIDIADALKSICDLVSNFKSSMLCKKGTKLFHTLIRGIVDDLESWRRLIFVTQEAIDIHFMDSSLLSSIAQLEAIIQKTYFNDTKNDVEFF